MSISVNFQGKTQTFKPPKKFSELKKHLKTKLNGLDKQAWEFYYYDQDNDDIQVVEEEEYQSLIDFAKDQKKAVKCQIRYKTSSKLEESKQDISDADSKSGEPAKLSSKSSRKNSDSSYVDTEKIQESEPQEEQKETTKPAIQPPSNAVKQEVKAPQKPPVKTQKMKQGSSSESQSSSEVEDDEQQEEEKEEKKDTIKPTQSKIVPEQPIKPQQPKIKESKPSEPAAKVSSSTAAQKQRVEQPPIKSSQPPKVKQSVKIQDSEHQKFQEKKMEKSRIPKIKKQPEKVQNIAESETVTVTIPKEQYERLLRVQKAYQNRQFEVVDREFASGIKNTTILEKCTFCAAEDNLNIIPTFESLLICDSCNQKFEIKLKVNPYRSKVSRNSSALSGNKLF